MEVYKSNPTYGIDFQWFALKTSNYQQNIRKLHEYLSTLYDKIWWNVVKIYAKCVEIKRVNCSGYLYFSC